MAADPMIGLSQLRMLIWSRLSVDQQDKANVLFRQISSDLVRVENLRVELEACRMQCRDMRASLDRRVPRYPRLVAEDEGDNRA